MLLSTKKKTGMLIREIFGMLVEHPDGLSTGDIWERLQRWQMKEFEGREGAKGPLLRSFEQVSFRCVAPIRAGWLHIDRNRWRLSDEGKKAYFEYSDPIQLMNEAGRHSVRGWLSVYFPRSYAVAGRIKDQVAAEYGAARRIGLRTLLKEAFSKQSPWQEVLPLQHHRDLVITSSATGSDSFIEYLDSLGVPYHEGGHAIYLPPESLKHPVLKVLADSYPPTAGAKIVKNEGGVDASGYVSRVGKGDSVIHLSLVHAHRQLTLVANLLYSKGLGPRLYDLVDLRWANKHWTAYITEHVSGGIPSMAQCESGIEDLRKLDRDGILTVIVPLNDEEFTCPTCAGNALVDDRGNFKYVDFQNFFLADYEKYLTAIAKEAAAKSHFGDNSVLRGGKYLYQTVPGVRLPGKRGINHRIAALHSLMEASGVSLKDKLVLDIGCNIGMMIGQYLKLGAKWCHGWDRAHITPHTERLLFALGCTRFSTTGGDITEFQPLEANLPPFLRSHVNGCVISYLAVRVHLGWLRDLGRIPWSFLIYEGHEGETVEHFHVDIAELKKLTDFEIMAVTEYVDGDSDRRIIAILKK